MAETLGLLDLPVEVLHLVLNNLRTSSIERVGCSCRTLHSVVLSLNWADVVRVHWPLLSAHFPKKLSHSEWKQRCYSFDHSNLSDADLPLDEMLLKCKSWRFRVFCTYL